MISRMREYGWTGLNTQANATGLEPLECVEFQDLVVKGLDAQRRDGLSERIASFAGDETAMDFVAADSEHIAVPMDTVAWALGLKFTVQVLVELDGTGDNQAVFYAGATTPSMALDTLSGNWRWRVWDSAGTLSTVTVGTAAASLQSIMLVRDGASLTTRLNDVAGGTGTIVATLSLRSPVGDLRFARNGGTDYLDGSIDYVRSFTVVKTHHRDRLVRFPHPRASYVACDYGFKARTGNIVEDNSKHENHGLATNSPTEVTTLCHSPSPVRCLSMTRDEDNRKQLLVVAGAVPYIVGVD